MSMNNVQQAGVCIIPIGKEKRNKEVIVQHIIPGAVQISTKVSHSNIITFTNMMVPVVHDHTPTPIQPPIYQGYTGKIIGNV